MMDKDHNMLRDRHGKELEAIVSHARTQVNGRVILFEIVVAHRCVLVTRDSIGQYSHALTTDFDRCGGRTRSLLHGTKRAFRGA